MRKDEDLEGEGTLDFKLHYIYGKSAFKCPYDLITSY